MRRWSASPGRRWGRRRPGFDLWFNLWLGFRLRRGLRLRLHTRRFDDLRFLNHRFGLNLDRGFRCDFDVFFIRGFYGDDLVVSGIHSQFLPQLFCKAVFNGV
jgi:hypothetical protein